MKPPESKYEGTKVESATFENPDIGLEYDGLLALWGNMNYEPWHQMFGYCIDEKFIKNLLYVFDKCTIGNCHGESCWVEHDDMKIHRIISPDLEREFDIKEWVADKS